MSYAGGREASSALLDQHQDSGAPSRSTSTYNRFSITSTETGESSQRENISSQSSVSLLHNSASLAQTHALTNIATPAQDGRGHHRSHKSGNSGGFLLSNPILEPHTGSKLATEATTRQRESHRDHKGKVALRGPEKKHTKKTLSVGLGIGGSPLTTSVTNAGAEQVENVGPVRDNSTQDSGQSIEDTEALAKPPKGLDAESAQIVSLALNLSESRRNAARRNMSSPLPPTLSGFSEGFAGGSLRQHLQQQRRASRNVSPKPERVDRVFSISQRVEGQRLESPLQAAFATRQDADYQYHFSSSTLARAEKAKKAIELMAQYRRLLQYVPPLKPNCITRAPTNSPPNTAPEPLSNSLYSLSRVSSSTASVRPLGRPYNPLQYIRNRKVRARERKAIDGEFQGFGDIEKVTHWADEVETVSNRDGYQTGDYISLPAFTMPSEEKDSPPSTVGRSQPAPTKSRRPRVDWMADPADMLADIYWLEQNENKRLIEDSRGRKIFPKHDRPVSGYEGKEYGVTEPEIKQEEPDRVLRVDTQFNSLRSNPDRYPDSARGRGLQKLHKGTHLLDDINSSSHEHYLKRSHHRSSSELSGSDHAISRRSMSVTADTHDLGRDVLEKQIVEVLAREAHAIALKAQPDPDGIVTMQSMESQRPEKRETTDNMGLGLGNKGEDQSILTGRGSRRWSDSLRQSRETRPLNRASLEVPEPYGRSSLEGLDSSVPNSPLARALRVATRELIPSIVMDLSPPHSRQSSPVRKPALARVKSKMHIFHDRSRDHSRSRSVSHSVRGNNVYLEEEPETSRQSFEIPFTPDRRKRSASPPKKVSHRKTDEKSFTSKAGSMRRRAEEIPSGIKGLFKSGRNPVARVSDFLWRKEMSPASAASSNTSTDDSDLEENKGSSVEQSNKYSRQHDGDLQVFALPFKLRGRSKAQGDDASTESPESDHSSQPKRDRRVSRFSLIQPPRIDVQNASPSSSPDLGEANRSSRNSDISDLEDRRRGAYGVQGADARLNAVLGIPGHPAHISGLANSRGRMTGKQWSIFDSLSPFNVRDPMSKRDAARVKALLLSSGIKAKEITRRAAELQDLRSASSDANSPSAYAQVAALNREPQLLKPVPRSQEHILAARVLSNDIQISSQMWQASAASFSTDTVGELLDRVEELQDRITGRNGLSEIARAGEREADEVSRDLVTGQTLKVKELNERMGRLLRQRRRRFRWVRKAGWVAVEWVLVGVLWWVWLVVTLIRIVRGLVGGVMGGVRWLLWL